MGSYFTGLMVAMITVVLFLGLLAFGQESPYEKIDADAATMDKDSLLEIAEDESAENRVEAILQLADSPGDLDRTVPVLAKLCLAKSELVRAAAVIALQKIGPAGAKHVQHLIESADVDEMGYGSAALKEMGGAKIYLDQLKKWSASPDSLPRKRVLFALQGQDSGAVEMMDFLIEALDDPDFNVQCMACRVLATLGTDAMPAEEKILELFKTGIPSTRSWAAFVIGTIGPTSKTDSAIVLGENLKAFLQIEKQRSLLGLAEMGPEASRVADLVFDAMQDENQHVMPHAAYAYWRITGESMEAIAVLDRLIDDPSYSDDAVIMAGRMQATAGPLVEKLTAKLNSDEPHVRELAVVALGNIGPGSVAATAEIQKLSERDPDALIRYAAKEALVQINELERTNGESENK